MILGNTAHLAFDLAWPEEEPREVAGLGWGALRLWVGGRLAWATESHEGVLWTWIDLVEHLARAWGHLCFEENAPFGLVTVGPEHLRKPGVLRSVRGVGAEVVEEAVHAFQHRHDLAAGLKGITLSPVWVLPAGNEVRVRCEGRDVFCARAEVLHTLEQVAEAVLQRVRANPAPRADAALARWQGRAPAREKVLAWRTGLPAATLAAWTPAGADPEGWWGLGEDDSPMMAAARLSEGLGPDTRRGLLRELAHVPACSTPALDRLSEEVQPVLEMVAGARPHEQGHDLALWLRGRLGCGDARVEPEDLLRGWGVHLVELPALEPELDAVACWGGGKGPAVLVNPQGKHASGEAGRRATLAHEIAHLLLDRGRQLPAAEVFGGATPLHLEQRARAFAAELLLPRDVAGHALASMAHVDLVLQRLARDYGVSREIVGWQIRNGTGWALLDAAARQKVKAWCGLELQAEWSSLRQRPAAVDRRLGAKVVRLRR